MPPAVDLTAAPLSIYLDPGDAVAVPITVPAGYETGTWAAKVYANARRGTALATFTIGAAVGQVITPTLTSVQVAALVTTGMSRFAGHWDLTRTVAGAQRTWLKGAFVVDAGRQVPANGTEAVELSIVSSTVTVTAGLSATGAELATETAARIAGDATVQASVTALGDPVTVAHGGTGASTADTARDALNVLSPGSPAFEGVELRSFRAAWAGRKTAPCTVLLLGDSNTVGYYATTEPERWARILSATLQVANGQRPSVGYVPRHSLTNYLFTWTSSGTVTEFATSGLGYAATSPAANGGWIETTQTCDRFWIRYTAGTLIGRFGVQIDGGPSVEVPAISGTIAGGYTWDSGPLARGAHAVRVTSTDATFPARIEGIVFFDGNGNTSGAQGPLSAVDSRTGAGVRVINGAKFATQAAAFAASSATTWWTDGLDRINPDLVLLAFGTNEITVGTTPTTMKTNMAAIIARINTVMATAGRPTPSYLFVVPHGTGADSAAFAPYRTAIIEAAAAAGGALLDRYGLTGFVGTAAADVWGITTTLDGATRVHLANLGQRLAGEHAADYLLRAVGHRPAGIDDTNLVPHHQLPALAIADVTGLQVALDDKVDNDGDTINGDLTVAGSGKAYRLRASGSALDLDGTGTDLFLSVFSGAAFDGPQRSYLRLESGASVAHAIGQWIFAASEFGGAVHTLDPTTGVAALGGKNGLAAIPFCGRKDDAGAPATGTWAEHDVVIALDGVWRCTAAGTPGTWVEL